MKQKRPLINQDGEMTWGICTIIHDCLDSLRKKAISLSSTFIKCQTSVTQGGTQYPFLLFLLSFLYLQHEQVWKRYADSFHMTGQTAHLVIKCTMKIIWWICQKYWNLIESCRNSLENHWKQKPTMLQIPQTNRCSIATVLGNANPRDAAADAMSFPALLHVALAKLKTVTMQTPIKRSILTRRMTLWTEHSETYSMDKGVCASGDDCGQLKVMNSIS